MSELQRGIQTIYNMEQNIYLMQNVLNDLDGQISRLGKQEHFSEPEKRTVYADFDNYIGKSTGASVLIAFIISIINIFIKLEKAGGGALSGAKFSALGSGFVFGFWCFVIAIAIGLIIGSIITFAKKSEQQDRAKRKYERAYKNYLEKIDNDTARVNVELAEKRILIAKRNMLKQKMSESGRLLYDMYLKSGIDKNYWGIIPIGYMNEFLRLKITDHLGGTDGLYYLVKREIKTDRLQYTVDEINSKLDTIIDNQSRIYSDLLDMKNKGDRLISETVRKAEIESKNNRTLKKIECNTALDAYYSQQAQAELKYMNDMNIIFRKWS
ncbi:hypothetical protein [Ruminococcus intestinalis]|uniref:hypothetical protein n=1 Tax=Ruminococcus intestinalis TaxID=2763066 RepID=UPI003F80DD61